MIGIHIFRRDLRLIDNRALSELAKKKCQILPIFIFTPQQIDIKKNDFRSDHAVQFMIDSLFQLGKDIQKVGGKLHMFYGDVNKTLENLCEEHKVNYISYNKDYTPYARKRDGFINDLCKKRGITVIQSDDNILLPHIQAVQTQTGNPNFIFGHFFKSAQKFKIPIPEKNMPNIDWLKNVSEIDEEVSPEEAQLYINKRNARLAVKPGRTAALQILKSLKKEQSKYDEQRDDLSYSTSRLATYLKFGNISIREAYSQIQQDLGESCGMLRQLYWRDFYYQALWYYPQLVNGCASRPQFRQLKWDYSQGGDENFKRWCDGQTGVPIVDAGMREMNQTGIMHNRTRMVVATFLIFNLNIDWQRGMKYFSQKLVDIDWALNQGNWQWVAGTEKWSNQFYQTLSMSSQTERFDPDANYIKQWVPETNDAHPNELANWDSQWVKNQQIQYQIPLDLDWKGSRLQALERMRAVVKKNQEEEDEDD